MAVETRTRADTASSGPRDRLSGWVMSLTAVASLVVGIGIGIRGLSVGAPAWRNTIGLVALAIGLASIVFGMARLLAGLRLWSRYILGVTYVVGMAVVVWTLTPAVIATSVPPITHGSLAPEDFGLDAEEVTFVSDDGVRLWAWFVPSRNGAAVLLRHGSGGTATSVLPHAAVLTSHGYGVLATDARGHGNSEGRAMDFGWYGGLDIRAAVDFLVDQEVNQTRIGVVGLSMGGEEAIGALGSDSRIAAVVAEGATARTDADKSWLSDVYGWRGWIQEKLEWIQYSFTDLLTTAPKPESLSAAAKAAAPRPVLLISAGEAPDEDLAAAFIAAETSNVSVWTVPGAGHVQGLAIDPDGWETVVVGFLDEVLVDR